VNPTEKRMPGDEGYRRALQAPSRASSAPAELPRAERRRLWSLQRKRYWLGRGCAWVGQLPNPVANALKAGVKSHERILAITAGLNRRERRVLKSKRRVWCPRQGPRRLGPNKWAHTPEKLAALAKLTVGLRELNARDRRLQSWPARLAGGFRRVFGWPWAVLKVLWRRLVR
jgi:hypothetical protein